MEEIISSLKSYNDKMHYEIKRAELEGYKEGFSVGFKKAFEVAGIELNSSNIDTYSIKIFSEWCYIHGIDFSYMAKGTDTVPFTERVIDKFKNDIENEGRG